MLRAGVFEDFKGATTLLLWGSAEGMAILKADLTALRHGDLYEFAIEGPDTPLTVCLVNEEEGSSTLRMEGTGFRWACSGDTLELAADLVEPLLNQAGHQFLDVHGAAEQVIIARDEYPADLR